MSENIEPPKLGVTALPDEGKIVDADTKNIDGSKDVYSSSPVSSVINTSATNSNSQNLTNNSVGPMASSTKLDKTVLSNLNKSLKVKQKIINTKEPQPKNSVLITDLLNRSPQATSFPVDLNSSTHPSTTNLTNLNLSNENTTSSTTAPGGNNANISTSGTNTPDISENIPNLQLNDAAQLNSLNLKKNSKKSSKQSANPTRTDIFAAKLASAVDDVDSSDSDETFVYENNSNDFTQRDNQAEFETENLDNVPLGANPDGEGANDAASEIRNNDEDNENTDDNDNESIIIGQGQGQRRSQSRRQNRDKLDDPASSDEEGLSANDTHMTFNLNSKDDNHAASMTDNGSVLETDFDSPPQVNRHERPERGLASESATSMKLPKNLIAKTQAVSNGSSNGTDSGTLARPRPSTQRTYSNHSIVYNFEDGSKRPLSPYNNNNSSFTSSSNHGYPSYKTYTDKYSEDDGNDSREDDEADDEDGDNDGQAGDGETKEDTRKFETEDEVDVDVDDLSSHDSFGSSKNLMTSSNTTTGPVGPVASNGSVLPKIAKNDKKSEQTNSITSKNTKKKSATPSSKLRSTASKLFDKKGSQPRRYSIIPDDIDIEDFDDELIYYDNNIRFPYNNNSINNLSNPSNNPSMHFTDQSPLINNTNSNQRIPHYRSLNLNPQQKRNRTKRYLSTGQPLRQSQSKQDIFPFPYPEQPNQSNYYFGFDEYDEENGSINEQQFDRLSRKQSSKFYHPGSNHFVLPRKQSFSNVKRTIYTMMSIISILTLGFLMGFFIATTKDLSNVAITDIQNPVVSQDELVFNILVEAVNPGWFTIGIKDVELDIFARSGYLPGDDDDEGGVPVEQAASINVGSENDKQVVTQQASGMETVLLGSITSLESEMTFQGVIFNRDKVQQLAEVKLLSPGKNITSFYSNGTTPDNSAKWSVISKNPFDLIVKGVLKYNLPLSKDMKTVVVNKTSYVDPSYVDPNDVVSN